MIEIPSCGGSYALLLRNEHPLTLSIGRLGQIAFPEGIYVYLGSAQGPGGLSARVGRHLSGQGKLHWHVDWIRRHAQIDGVWWTAAKDPCECTWSRSLAGISNASIVAPGFGASDCIQGCLAHLVFFGKMEGRLCWRRTFEEICSRLSGACADLRFCNCVGSAHQSPGPSESCVK